MKINFKNSILLAGLVLLTIFSKAQNKSALHPGAPDVVYSAGIESGFSTGNTRYNYPSFLGGSAQIDVPLFKKTKFNANIGYSNYFGKSKADNILSGRANIHLLPITIGLKTFFTKEFYIQGNQGIGWLLNKQNVGYSHPAAYIFTQQLGLQIPVQTRNYLDIGLLYRGSSRLSESNNYSKLNSISIRVAFAY